MENFKKIDRPVIGSVSRFEFVRVEDIQSFSNQEPMPKSLLVLITGASWQQGWGSHDSLKFTEVQKINSQGVFYECTLVGFLPDDEYLINDNFRKSHHQDFIVKLTDSQGLTRILGTPDDPARFTFSFDTKGLSGPKGYKFSFKAILRKPAIYLDIPPVEFQINENGNLIQERSNTETFALNTDGELVVTGPNEGDYALNLDGQLIKA